MVELPDVNVLIALFDANHTHHDQAQAWFATVQESGWATCPLTENGFLRVAANPNYESLRLSVAEIAAGLRLLIATCQNSHHFWPDDISLRDEALFSLERIRGYRQATDLYLLGLCQRHGATFVTFDGGVQETARAIVAASPDLLRLLA